MDKATENKKYGILAFTICVLLALMVWGVFGRTLRHDFVNFDDGMYVYKNPAISEGVTLEGMRWVLTHPHGFNWHPLTSFSHMLDCQIYGLNPAGHHRTNVLLHMATVILFFLVLRQMTGSLWRSAFVAAVFAIHPLRVESVAWISERKDVLSGLFFMLTLGAYLRYVRRPSSAGRYAAVAVSLTLGLMSKAMLVTLPFVLLLLDFWPLKRFQTLKTKETIVRLVDEKIPLLLLAAVFCGMTVWAQQGAIVPGKALPVLWRFGSACCAYVIYMKQMLFPTGLAVLYPHPPTGFALWKIGLSLILLAGISLAVFIKRKKRPYLMVGWLWYLGMLVPVIGIMQVGVQAHADRYTYLPQIGLILMLTWLVADSWPSQRYRLTALSIISATVLVTLMAMACRQTAHWRNSRTLWEHTLAHTKNNDMAHYNLGCFVLFENGEFDTAIEHFKQAVRIYPDFVDAHNNLGSALVAQGKFTEALEHYQRVLQREPDNALAHDNVSTVKKVLALYKQGVVLLSRKQFGEAIHCFEQILGFCPDYAEAHDNLGVAFEGIGKLDAALEHYGKALADSTQAVRIHDKMGNILIRQGQPGKALPHFEAVLRINPDSVEAQNNLARILATCPDAALRDGQRAVELARSADRLSRGNHAPILDTLAAAYAEAGRYPEAIATARRALDATTDQKAADGIRKRLELYQAGHPYHESEEMNSNDLR